MACSYMIISFDGSPVGCVLFNKESNIIHTVDTPKSKAFVNILKSHLNHDAPIPLVRMNEHIKLYPWTMEWASYLAESMIHNVKMTQPLPIDVDVNLDSAKRLLSDVLLKEKDILQKRLAVHNEVMSIFFKN